MTEIKQNWDDLSEAERQTYEKKAADESTKLKAQRYREQSFHDKKYGV